MSKLGDVATKAILKEMDQMISKNVFHPVLLDELSKKDRRSIICCLIFLKEKYKADGSFDKVKGRLEEDINKIEQCMETNYHHQLWRFHQYS